MPISKQSNPEKICARPASRQRLKAGVVFCVIMVVFSFFFAVANGRINIGRFILPCGFKQQYGLPCPTCGMTTSILAFVRGRIFEAFYIQPAAAFLCCLLIVAAVWAFLIAVFAMPCGFITRCVSLCKFRYIVLVIIIIITGGWAVTLVRALVAGAGP